MERQATKPAGSIAQAPTTTGSSSSRIGIPVGVGWRKVGAPSLGSTIVATGALQNVPVSAGTDVPGFARATKGDRERSNKPVRDAGERSTRGKRSRSLRLWNPWGTKHIVDLENSPENPGEEMNVHEKQDGEATPPKSTDERKDEDGPGRKLASRIFKPMGLWVDTRSRKLIDDDNRANGFPRVTTFIASDPDRLTSIYRRFDKLNVRNLLLLEAKVAALEALQEKFDIEDANNLKGDWEDNWAMSNTHSSFEYFALLGEGKDVIETDDSESPGEGENGIKRAAQLEPTDDGENAREVSRLRSLSEPGDAKEANRLRSLSDPLDASDTNGMHIKNTGQIDRINIAIGSRGELLGASKADGVYVRNTGKIDRINIAKSTRSEPLGARKVDGVRIRNMDQIDRIDITKGMSSETICTSGIPACAFRKWNESREDVLRAVRENIEATAASSGAPNDTKQAVIQTVMRENRRYWQDRWEVAQAIQHALKEYQEAVILQNKMLKLENPTEGTVRALRKYVGGAYYMKDGVEITTKIDKKTGEERNLRPPQFREDSAVTKTLKDDGAFVSLNPPGDDDLGTWLAAKCFGWLLKRRGDDNPEFDDVSEIAVGRFTTVWTFFVAIGFLMGAVWFIWRVGLEEVNVEVKFERKLAILTAFTGLFGGWVALFTSAKRYEIFGATAAYAAVLIVFVGVDPGDAIGP